MVHHSILFALLAGATASVSAHGVFVATGQNGPGGFGMDPSTPRDGTRRNPFQQDSSIIRNRELASGKAGPCGRTLQGGDNDVTTQLAAAEKQGLATVGSDGTVSMTLHQVNGDGAGPYQCGVSADASGSNFATMQVTQNVPGRNSRSTARATDFQMQAAMPAGTKCTGGADGATCLVMCRNNAAAGPFGGCMAFTQGGNSTAAAAGAGAATGAAAPAAQATGATAAAGSTGVQGQAGTQGQAGAANRKNKNVVRATADDATDAEIEAAEAEEEEQDDDDDEETNANAGKLGRIAPRRLLTGRF